MISHLSLFTACDPCNILYAYTPKPASCCLFPLLSALSCSTYVLFGLVSSLIPSRGLALFPCFPFTVTPQHAVQGLPRLMRSPPNMGFTIHHADEPFFAPVCRHLPTLLSWYSYTPRYISSHPVWFFMFVLSFTIHSPNLKRSCAAASMVIDTRSVSCNVHCISITSTLFLGRW